MPITELSYSADGKNFHGGFFAAANAQAPTVLIAPTWAGRGPLEEQRAAEINQLGYHALVLDFYGEGKRGSSPEENAKLMQPLMENRLLIRARADSAIGALRNHDLVGRQPLAIIGYCFGGLCALDVARSELDVAAAVSFHGLLHAPPAASESPITASILVLHGWDDPMARPDAVIELADELTRRGADWQVLAFGHQVHAFTNPAANDRSNGLQYDRRTEERAWAAMARHLEEAFAPFST